MFVYLDDILIYSLNMEQHIQQSRTVLHKLYENQLFVKLEKCEFHVTAVSFLGFIFEGGQYCMDPEKTKAVLEWPIPETKTQRQRLLGFENFYRHFINLSYYSQIAAPLTQLTSTLQTFKWTPEANAAFDKLKLLFFSTPYHLPR